MCSLVSKSVERQTHNRDLKYLVYILDRGPLDADRSEVALCEAKERPARYPMKRVDLGGGTGIEVKVEVEMRKCRTGLRTVREISNYVGVQARVFGKPTIVERRTKG